MVYRGSCHCGNIAFEAEGELTRVIECNCSICSRKGALLWFIPRHSLRVLTPAERISSYTFNSHTIKHRFCPTCGIQPFGEGVDTDGTELAAINVRCLEEVDLSALQIEPFDGRSL
jgi:hypothetical protein